MTLTGFVDCCCVFSLPGEKNLIIVDQQTLRSSVMPLEAAVRAWINRECLGHPHNSQT